MSSEANTSTGLSVKRRIFRAIERAFAVIGFLLVLYHVCFHISVISSGSMSPTLRGEKLFGGDVVLTERPSLWFRKPHRWEVVRFYDETGLEVMKRVVGLPGESVALKDTKTVLINGQVASFPDSLRSLKYYAYGNLMGGRQVACGDGFYVLGDDSADSQDSRYTGPLHGEQIHGRPWMVMWPPSHMRFVNP